MLDGLLGRGGFSSKCKSLIKPTRARIEALRRRAEAKQRFLKEDLAKLLANGLDVNAYGRTEEFIAGLNLLSCYTFLDQSCEYILKQLSIMQKQGQCPEECRETVASLMFAAARFSDLPELRDLRDVFQERYGDGLECFVNQVFVEKLSSKPPVIEKRVKLLQDIASEFSIQWDSNGFKKRMDKPSTPSPEAAFKKHGLEKNDTPLTIKNPGSSYCDRKPEAFENRGRKEKPLENEENGGRLFRGTHGFEKNGTPLNTKHLGSSYLDTKPEVLENRGRTEKHLENGDNDDRLFKGTSGFEKNNTPLNTKRSGSSGGTYHAKRPEALDDDIVNRGRKEKHSYKHDPSTIRADTIVTQDNNDRLFRTIKSPRSSRDKRPEILGNDHVPASLPDLFYHAKSDGVNGCANQQNDVKLTRKPHDEEAVNLKTCYNNSLPPPYVKSNIPPPYSKPKDYGSRPHDTIMDPSPPNHTPTENRRYQNEIPLPKPRSMRRKYSKSSSTHDDIGSSEDSRIVKRVSSSRRKERKGLQILFDDEHYHRDDEEKMMDKLLLHYSKKPSAYDIGKLKKKKSRSNNSSKSPHHRSKSKDEVTDDVDINVIAPPARSISLPHEQIGEMETKKVYARANSFQPDNQAKHVHPKLPDYDDLAARFAALRGR